MTDGLIFGALPFSQLPMPTKLYWGTISVNQFSNGYGKHLAKENTKFSFG
jgi:hypothetical protein